MNPYRAWTRSGGYTGPGIEHELAPVLETIIKPLQPCWDGFLDNRKRTVLKLYFNYIIIYSTITFSP